MEEIQNAIVTWTVMANHSVPGDRGGGPRCLRARAGSEYGADHCPEFISERIG